MKLFAVKPVYDYNITMTRDWKGKNNPRWNGGKRTLTSGYIMVKADPADHSVTKDGYILEHRLVMEKNLHRKLTRLEVIHHKNHDRKDNSIENLKLVSSQSGHMKESHNNLINYKKPKLFVQCIKCERKDVKNSTKDLCHMCYMRVWRKKN